MRNLFAKVALGALLLGSLQLSAPALAQQAEQDPLEGLNRRVFAFNEFLDRAVLKPTARGYQAVTPGFLDDGVTNFFGNLGEVPAFLNHLLQGRLPEAGADGGRFVVNTSLGLLGLFDVASKMGLERQVTDFGVTLGRWGVGSGPYLVLPVLGPSTLRDGVGRAGDIYISPLYHVDDERTQWSLRALEAIDLRADLLEAEGLITGDRYVFLRDLYLQRREFLITGELAEDDFGEEDF